MPDRTIQEKKKPVSVDGRYIDDAISLSFWRREVVGVSFSMIQLESNRK